MSFSMPASGAGFEFDSLEFTESPSIQRLINDQKDCQRNEDDAISRSDANSRPRKHHRIELKEDQRHITSNGIGNADVVAPKAKGWKFKPYVHNTEDGSSRLNDEILAQKIVSPAPPTLIPSFFPKISPIACNKEEETVSKGEGVQYNFYCQQSSKSSNSSKHQDDIRKSRNKEIASGLSDACGDYGLSIEELSRLPSSAVQCFAMLLEDRENQINETSFFSSRLDSVRSELEAQRRAKESLKHQLEREKTSRAFADNKYEALKSSHREEKVRWAKEKAEMNMQYKKLQTIEAAHVAQALKKEREYNRLQDAMRNKFCKDSGKETRELRKSKAMPNAAGLKKSNSNNGSVLITHETRTQVQCCQSAEKENLRLRKTLLGLVQEFVKLREYHLQHEEIEISREKAASVDASMRHNGTDSLVKVMPVNWLEEHLGNVMGDTAIKMQKSVGDFLHRVGKGENLDDTTSTADISLHSVSV